MRYCKDFEEKYPKANQCCGGCHTYPGDIDACETITVGGVEYTVCCEKIDYLKKNKILFHVKGKLK